GDCYPDHIAPEIQIRPRKEKCQQEKCPEDLLSQYTAKKRIRVQVYHEDYVNQYEEDTYITHPRVGLNNMDISDSMYDLQEQKVILDTFNCHNHKKESVTLLHEPAPVTVSQEMNSIREGPLHDHYEGGL
ncbi:hypothetical protein KI387_040397, partial [Taxus chinensis]